MPPDPQNQESTYLDRLIALRLLRENMFFEKPDVYGWSDIAEDMPGGARAVGGIIKNIAPSLAIIEKDPEARKAQIDKAVERIKNSQGSKEGLKKEIIDNVINMAKGSVIPSLGLSLAFQLLGFRMPWASKIIKKPPLINPITGEKTFQSLVGGRKFRSPINPILGIKRLFSSFKRPKLIRDTINDTMLGVGLSAAAGAIVPIAAHGKQISPKALEDARKILERDPYLTSLPASEMMSAIKEETNEPPNRLKNLAIGAGLGALTGAAAAIPTLLVPGGKFLASRGLAATKPAVYDALKNKFLRTAKNNLLFGGVGLGGALGAFSGLASTGNVIDDEYERINEEKKLNAATPQNNINPL
jgi:hypothetical protein